MSQRFSRSATDELRRDLDTFRGDFERLRAEVSELWARATLGDWRFVLDRLSSARGLSVLLVIVVVAVLVRLVRRMPAKRERAVRPMEESRTIPPELIDGLKALDRDWKKLGLARPPSRAPLEHWLALPKDKVPPEFRSRSRRFIDCFYRASFGSEEISAEEIEALEG